MHISLQFYTNLIFYLNNRTKYTPVLHLVSMNRKIFYIIILDNVQLLILYKLTGFHGMASYVQNASLHYLFT